MKTMQLEGHGSYWKAKIFKIQEFQLLTLLLKKNGFFLPELPLVTLLNYPATLFKSATPDIVLQHCHRRCTTFWRWLTDLPCTLVAPVR